MNFRLKALGSIGGRSVAKKDTWGSEGQADPLRDSLCYPCSAVRIRVWAFSVVTSFEVLSETLVTIYTVSQPIRPQYIESHNVCFKRRIIWDFLTAVSVEIAALLDVILFSLVDKYKRFGGTTASTFSVNDETIDVIPEHCTVI
jgi:hypothetical protein